jgi:large subunit ribosomal protein L6
MSRIGKKIIAIPSGVEVNCQAELVSVKGPKGELSLTLPPGVMVKKDNQQIAVSVRNSRVKREHALWGTSRSLVANMIEGVTNGFSKKLEINGVGFKAQVKDDKLILNLGFSHPVEFPFPAGITIKSENNIITVEGIDKYLVGETAAEIRALKKPEPYKGKGIKYSDEVIRRKAGKVVKSGE